MWFAFRFYLCIQSQQSKKYTNIKDSCDLLSDFIFVFNHNRKSTPPMFWAVVICFQILSLYSITTSLQRKSGAVWLWFAFRFYLCIQSQQGKENVRARPGCDLLSDFIFVFNHNVVRYQNEIAESCDLLSDFIFVFNHNTSQHHLQSVAVVICFQILSLYSITTKHWKKWRTTWLWFAFRFYLCIQSQQNHQRKPRYRGCDLLSDFIFVFNHNKDARLHLCM